MSATLRRNDYKGLNIIDRKLSDVELVNDILKLLKVRKSDTIAKLKQEHGYSDKALKEDLGNDILT